MKKTPSSIVRYSSKIVFVIYTVICTYVMVIGCFSSNIYAESLSNIINNLESENLIASDTDIDDFIENMENSENNEDLDYTRDLEDEGTDIDSLETINSKYNWGIYFNFGSQVERERLGTSFIIINSKKIRSSVKLSFGKWDSIKFRYNEDDYKSESKNFGSNLELFYYPRFFFPIYFNLATGYYYWSGDIKPISSVDSEKIKDLRSDFHLHTIMVSSSMGWEFHFKDGWFFQHCLFGIGSVFTINSNFSDNEVSQTKSAFKHKLTKPFIFGLLNLGIGKLF